MRTIRLALGLAAAAATSIGVTAMTGLGNADSTTAAPATAVATIRDTTGANIGTLTLVQIQSNAVLVTASLSHLPAGFHGFHIHQTGICDANATDANGNRSPFATAGAHFNPTAATHGDHAGDLPALLVLSGGSATAVVRTDRFTVNSLFDADGSAIIVHSAPDNLANIPSRYVNSTTGVAGPDATTLATGDSGARTACGVVRRG
jgi:superoxide dismutase, Cu-Zn family